MRFIDLSGFGEVIRSVSREAACPGRAGCIELPSGGIRSTFEARGYTAWDMSSPAFIRRNGISTTLCIPTAFISYTGEPLDKKTPLLRSNKGGQQERRKHHESSRQQRREKGLFDAGTGTGVLPDRCDYFFKRQDLVLGGRTRRRSASAKGQELEDQYFGSIKERIASYMHDMEEELFKLGRSREDPA